MAVTAWMKEKYGRLKNGRVCKQGPSKKKSEPGVCPIKEPSKREGKEEGVFEEAAPEVKNQKEKDRSRSFKGKRLSSAVGSFIPRAIQKKKKTDETMKLVA